MLKITDTTKHQEIATTKSQREVRALEGKTSDLVMDCLKLKSARFELEPKPIIEIILSYCDEDGVENGTTDQFCLRGQEAEQFIDRKKFKDFMEYLEGIAVETSDEKHADLQRRGMACKIPCAKTYTT